MINSFNNLSLQQKEDLIQPLLENIANNNKKDIAFFFELFSDDIYNFPIKYFSFNEDDAGDFYLYAYEHLKNGKKIASFKYKSKFTTWFFSVLRNLVIDYLRKNKNKLSFLPFNKLDSNGNAIDLVDNIPDNVEQENLNYDEDILNKFIIKLNTMKTYNRVLFKLAFIHYIDLNEDEIDW
ncbi:MAG: sigma-70 family RNA polymerase sigma factor, partial [Spirochaetia bacterium]|nr:sigma-70 family RNA polymerase sigma factor [Spirochaetia bacterium]